MRRLMGVIVAAMLVVAGQAYATTLGFVNGSLSVSIAGLAPITATATGTATVTNTGTSLTSLQVPAGVFNLPFFSIPITDPAAAPIKGIQALNVKNGAVLTGFAMPSGVGKMAIQGKSKVCLFGACNATGTVNSTHPHPSANLVVPFTVNGTRGVGIGGGQIAKQGAVNISVQGNPWLAGVAKIGTASVAGFIHGPASGGASTAAQFGGMVQLVTPTLISTNIGASAAIPSFGILNLTFIPEPGTLLLLGSGVVGLSVLGRRRMSK